MIYCFFFFYKVKRNRLAALFYYTHCRWFWHSPTSIQKGPTESNRERRSSKRYWFYFIWKSGFKNLLFLCVFSVIPCCSRYSRGSGRNLFWSWSWNGEGCLPGSSVHFSQRWRRFHFYYNFFESSHRIETRGQSNSKVAFFLHRIALYRKHYFIVILSSSFYILFSSWRLSLNNWTLTF